jgi:ribosomal protein S10
LNKKGKRLWKIQSFKRINNLKFLKQKLSPKRKKYFHKWDLRHISIGKNISIKKKVLIPEGKVIRNKLFYNFLIRKYTSNENTSFKEVHISWYLSIKKSLSFTLVTFDKKSLYNMDRNFSKTYKTFFNIDNVLLKSYPLKKTCKLQTLLKSPHVNKKAQQHFSKIEYSKTYSFTFDSNKVSLEKIHLLLSRLINLNLINIKFKVHYSYK